MALSKMRENELEDAALRALGKRPIALVNGFRVMGDAGQVAAIYWSDNMPGNDVEIALCDIRLSEQYDLRTIRRWINVEQNLSGRECNVHKHGSDWPIIGFSYDGALAFLKRCMQLRKGLLDGRLVSALKAAESDSDDCLESLEVSLSGLRPTSKPAVMDLVKKAGVDVASWYITGEQEVVENPRSNPAFCYNWSFGGNGEPVVVCLWHNELKIDAGQIVYADNLREHAASLQKISNIHGEEQEVRNRAQTQARRALKLDAAIAGASKSNGIVRVIVNEGFQRAADRIGLESSEVEARMLDNLAWRVAEYDNVNGRLRLARNDIEAPSRRSPDAGAVRSSGSAKPAPIVMAPVVRFEDQYSVVVADVEKIDSMGSVYSRSRAVRDAAMGRANGTCELCGRQGFLTRSGAIYLETHHVQPLSEGGADSEANVAALCPDDHRRAHYSAEAEEIRKFLQTTLANIYMADADRAAQRESGPPTLSAINFLKK